MTPPVGPLASGAPTEVREEIASCLSPENPPASEQSACDALACELLHRIVVHPD